MCSCRSIDNCQITRDLKQNLGQKPLSDQLHIPWQVGAKGAQAVRKQAARKQATVPDKQSINAEYCWRGEVGPQLSTLRNSIIHRLETADTQVPTSFAKDVFEILALDAKR